MKSVTTLNNKPLIPNNRYKMISVAVLLCVILFIAGFYLTEINHTTDAYPLTQTDALIIFIFSVVSIALFQFWALPQFGFNILILFLPSLIGMAAAFFFLCAGASIY